MRDLRRIPGGSHAAYGGVVTSAPALDERLPDRLTWWDTTWRVGLALLLGLVFWGFTAALVFPDPDQEPETWRGLWLVLVDPLLGLVAAGCLLLRRRWPVAIATITTLLTGASTVAAGAQTIALASLATRQRWREILPVGALTVAAGLFSARIIYPEPGTDSLPLWAEALVNVLVVGIIVAVGYSIGSRRALVRSWVERAQTAESEQRARVAQAQTAERSRIAREMHDVLAHRISLVTMHSGLLSYRQDLPEDERRAAVTAIDTNARAALTDLREVLGVLRDDDEGSPLRPQGTLADLPELLDDVRSAGTRVSLGEGGPDLTTLPETTSRTAYRVIQEGLTNARKHAPAATVTVHLAGRPGSELEVTISNPRSLHRDADPVPGAGVGLLGLSERVTLAGGRLSHGWHGDEHRLAVWLPWAS